MKNFLRKFFDDVFGVLAVLSFVSLVIGFALMVAGTFLGVGGAAWAERMQSIGYPFGEIGLAGVAFFGWLYTRREKKRREDRFKVEKKDWKDSVLH